MQNQKLELSKGFLIVASGYKKFYLLALNLMESIRDYYPEANICLVTEKTFCDGRESVANNIIYCDKGHREKLWALSRSPYDLTMYIDADCEIQHEDISTAFDQIGNNDMMFTELTEEREYCFAMRKWKGGELKLCGGIFLYNKTNPLVKEFMDDWDKFYHDGLDKTWWPLNENGNHDFDNHPYHLSQWDQFTLWYLTEKEPKYKDLKIGIFEDDARWNYFSLYRERYHHTKKPPIIFHFSALANKKEMVDYD
jgi:hypothetical protein